MLSDHRIGFGYDIHRTTTERPLILCGVQVPSPFGLLGHSDADVALHALMDALLGAIGKRDIGYHFPDTDERYSGADSTELLHTVMQMVREAGYEVVNADVTIIAQQPRLSSHIPMMIAHLGDLLETTCVNVKATTHEHLGPLGNSEGIAAQAVVLLTLREPTSSH